MAAVMPSHTSHEPSADSISDYGSDLDEDTAFELLSQAESQPLRNVVLESIEDPIIKDDGAEEQHAHLRIARSQCSDNAVLESVAKSESNSYDRYLRETSVEVEYDERNRIAFSPSNPAEELEQAKSPSLLPIQDDTRPPIERFRSRRPLSVTDLVSPAWCEQQYMYSLSKYGRVRKTPAMKQGSTVHKKLEEEVHVRVPIEVVSKEDKFGLRIWNTIQGLRTLRETGLTRELEVWGVLGGEVVIGIIDEISINRPDEAMEAKIMQDVKDAETVKKGKKSEQLAPDQRTLTDFLTSLQNGSILENHSAFLGTLREEQPRTYYLIDVKTRQSKSLPGTGSQLRPTQMQLMIYHRLLSSLASNETPAEKVFERYQLQSNATFSDKFIAAVANLDIGAIAPQSQPSGSAPIGDSLSELLEHNTLASLWSLLISEFAQTFPQSPSHTPISPLLTAEFRTGRATYTNDGEVLEPAGSLIGRRSFVYDAARIDAYTAEEIRWWKGERETVGVDVEEAYKCRICEFAEVCMWRATKVEDGLRKAKLRSEARRRSEV